MRRDNLKAVLDNSGDLYDTLGYINEWLATANDKVQALADERVDTQTEANMITVSFTFILRFYLYCCRS